MSSDPSAAAIAETFPDAFRAAQQGSAQPPEPVDAWSSKPLEETSMRLFTPLRTCAGPDPAVPHADLPPASAWPAAEGGW